MHFFLSQNLQFIIRCFALIRFWSIVVVPICCFFVFLRPLFWLLGSNVEFREILVWSFRLRDDIMLADPNSYRFVWWEAPRFWPIYWAGEWWTENQRRGTVMVLGWWEQDYSCMICSVIILALIRNYLLWYLWIDFTHAMIDDDCIGDHFKLHLIYKWTSEGVRCPNRQISPRLSVPDLILYPPLLNRDIPKLYTSSWWFQLFQLCFTLVFSHLFRERFETTTCLWLVFVTPLKANIDTKNDGLEDVSPFKHGYFG